MNNQDFIDALIAFRLRKIPVVELSNWISKNEKATGKFLTKSEYLCLKFGRAPELYEVISRKTPQCSECKGIEVEMLVTDIDIYWKKISELEQLKFVLIDKPEWFIPPQNRVGIDSYYQCSHCGATWAVFMPDLSIKGGFARIM